ncbi:MAG: GDP-4-dehydro-6-deoxy-D-mannose reductase [Candidatus Omnitrophota bacterium]|jgi:GDP-4-dehydro-6-deoxy-D-mannose reductase
MRILITGLGGFIGRQLAKEHISDEVHGLCRPGTIERDWDGLDATNRIHECDMRVYESVRDVLKRVQPERIYHLAAKSNVGMSWQGPRDTYETNILSQLHLLEAMRELKLKARVLIAGSSEEYGLVKAHENPITENTRLSPVSPYGVSKVTQDLMAHQYFWNYQLDVIRIRSFNQTGPGRSEAFVTSSFARQVVLMENNKQAKVMRVGNVEVVRDFMDIRDGVSAWKLLGDKAVAGEVYNICSGEGILIMDLINMLKSLTSIEFEVKTDAGIHRPSDVPVLIGDNSKLRQCTGWEPKITLRESMEDLLNYWRNKID